MSHELYIDNQPIQIFTVEEFLEAAAYCLAEETEWRNMCLDGFMAPTYFEYYEEKTNVKNS